MRYVWSLAVCALVYAACGGESDDGGGGTGGASDAGAGEATTGGSGGSGWGATGGGGSSAQTCNCPDGTVCVAWCKGDGQTFKTACVAPTTDGGCSGVCGNDYPWNCGFAFCQGAPKGAQFCMGA